MDIRPHLTGKCHFFAIALMREFNFRLLILTNRAEMYKRGVPATVHIYAVDEADNAYDVLGKHSASDIIDQWMFIDDESRCRPGHQYLNSEKLLKKFTSSSDMDFSRPLIPYTQADIDAALQIAKIRLPDLFNNTETTA
jgi:hypothetical protein